MVTTGKVHGYDDGTQGTQDPGTQYWEPFTVMLNRQKNKSQEGRESPPTCLEAWRPITDGIACMDESILIPGSWDMYGQAITSRDSNVYTFDIR